MKNFILMFIPSLLVLLSSCDSGRYFKIEGSIEGGVGEMIYLEHTGLMKNTLLDSTAIKSDGTFRLKAKRPPYPDFYKLVLGVKQIHFSVDSTETLTISCKFDNFSTDYTISGSETNNDILTLRKSVAEIQREANQLLPGSSNRETQLAKILDMIEKHKEMARPIILKNPRSTAAYFAIYQKINDSYIFSPYDKSDRPYCAAVATSYNTYMPDYERSKHLYRLVMDAIKSEKEARNRENWEEIIKEVGVGYIDIELPDRKGNKRKLSDLNGKVILLDFSLYESRESIQYTFSLRELYNKYASKGFEIYQVSLDRNKILWQDAVENIPWICVRDENGPNTIHAKSYNITAVPSYFLINKEGDLLGRDMNIQTLDREIQKLL